MNEKSTPMQENEMNRIFSAIEILDKRTEELFQSCHYFINEAKYTASPLVPVNSEKQDRRSQFFEEINSVVNRLNNISEKINNLKISIEK